MNNGLVEGFVSIVDNLLSAERILALESEARAGSVTSDKSCEASVSSEVKRDHPPGDATNKIAIAQGLWAILFE